MAMTKKDYELIAKAFSATRKATRKHGNPGLRTLDVAIETMAALIAMTHDNFKKDVFLRACRGENSNN
jgi:hypothetical protein